MSQPITPTVAQYAQAQARLAAFLEDKYAIKNQSKGLMAYGAALILGYDNHHQLKASLTDDNKPLKCQSEDVIFDIVSAHDETLDTMLENKLGEDFNRDDVLALLREEFNINEGDISDALIERLLAFMNQPVGWEVLYYETKVDYDALNMDFLIGDFTLFEHVREELKAQQAIRPLNDKGAIGGPIFKVQSTCGEHIFVLSSKEELDDFLSTEAKEIL